MFGVGCTTNSQALAPTDPAHRVFIITVGTSHYRPSLLPSPYSLDSPQQAAFALGIEAIWTLGINIEVFTTPGMNIKSFTIGLH